MVVDLLRSAYETDVRFWSDSSRTVRIRWYRVANNTPVLPFPTIFSSYVWDNENGRGPLSIHGTPLQGEQLGEDRPFDTGTAPTPPQTARQPCGTADQWRGDLLVARDAPLEVDDDGNPRCCTGRPARRQLRLSFQGTPFAFIIGYGINDNALISADLHPDPAQLRHWTGACGFIRWLDRTLHYHLSGIAWDVTESATDGSLTLTAAAAIQPAGVPILWQAVFHLEPGSGTLPTLADSSTAYVDAATASIPNYVPRGYGDMLIGSIIFDAGTDAVPAGFLVCDGSAVSRSTYSLLFGRVGITYGAGDGLTTFNLPNLRDNMPIGSGHLYGTGAAGGEAAHTLTDAEVPATAVTVTDPGHEHDYTDDGRGTLFSTGGSKALYNSAGQVGGVVQTGASFLTNIRRAYTSITAGVAGLGGAHNNLPPYLALRPLIYTGV
jgi:microcystin-dependent protein